MIKDKVLISCKYLSIILCVIMISLKNLNYLLNPKWVLEYNLFNYTLINLWYKVINIFLFK